VSYKTLSDSPWDSINKGEGELQNTIYPRVASFEAVKQSTGICEHPISFSSSKYITLNKLSCFQ